MTLLITGLIFINLLFFALIGIGGASMASVEGIASPLIPAIFLFWICAHIPYGFYIVSLIKNKKSEKKLNATRRSISLSAWLAFSWRYCSFYVYWIKTFLGSSGDPVNSNYNCNICLFEK